MIRVFILAAVMCVFIGPFATKGQAQSVVKQVFGDRADKAVKQVAPVVAPVTTVIVDITQGKKPEQAVKDVAIQKLQVMTIVPDTAAKADQMMEDLIKKDLPPDIRHTVELIRLPEKLQKQMEAQVLRTGISVLKDGRIPDIASAPLAAALHQAHDLYKGRAKPIPSGVSYLLRTSFDKAILNNAKYVIDDNLGSLPAIINKFQEQIGADNHAVTIDDIIVFAKDPGVDALFFWAHEIQHTSQYRDLGIEGFATKYLENSKAMEDDADNKAKDAVAKATVILEFVQATMADRQAN